MPISVEALSDVRLEESRIYDINSLDLAVPNLNFRSFGSRSSFGFLSIRGLGSTDLAVDPAVGVYIDDIPITDFVSLNSASLFDLDSVEVLRGPQSTLWGLNTEAGAVLLYTKDPGNEWSGTVKAEAGTDGLFLGQGALSGPLIEDKLFLGLAVAADTFDGDVENIFDGDPINEEDAIGLRSKLVWTPTDRLEVKLSLFADNNSGGAAQVLLPFDRSLFNTTFGRDIDEFEVDVDDVGESNRDSNTQSLRVSYENRLVRHRFHHLPPPFRCG